LSLLLWWVFYGAVMASLMVNSPSWLKDTAGWTAILSPLVNIFFTAWGAVILLKFVASLFPQKVPQPAVEEPLVIEQEDAAEILSLVQEAFEGMAPNECLAEDPRVTGSVLGAMKRLDLYLTGSTDSRNEQDENQVKELLTNGETWTVPLSDGISVLSLRWPTENDSRTLFLAPPLGTAPISFSVRQRWNSIASAA